MLDSELNTPKTVGAFIGSLIALFIKGFFFGAGFLAINALFAAWHWTHI